MSDTPSTTPTPAVAAFLPFKLSDGSESRNLDTMSIEELDAERTRIAKISRHPQMDDLDETTLRYFLEIGSRLRTNTVGPAKPKARRGGAEVQDLF